MLTKKQLESYVIAKELLAKAKAEEMEQRLAICEEILEGKEKGTTTELLFDIEIKAVKKINIALDKKLLSSTYEDMSEEEQECILFEPKLIAKEYQFLQEHDQTPLLDDCITVKDATPSLTITLPEDQ